MLAARVTAAVGSIRMALSESALRSALTLQESPAAAGHEVYTVRLSRQQIWMTAR